MKSAVRFLSDRKGKTQSVQVSISHWTRIMNKLNKYEQMLKVKSDLTQAFKEVKRMSEGKVRKQSLQDFLNEL